MPRKIARITAAIPEWLEVRLEKFLARMGTSKSEYIRNLILRDLECRAGKPAYTEPLRLIEELQAETKVAIYEKDVSDKTVCRLNRILAKIAFVFNVRRLFRKRRTA